MSDPQARILKVAELDLTYEPAPWPFAEDQADRIDDFWAERKAAEKEKRPFLNSRKWMAETPAARARYAEMTPAKRLGTPADVAGIAVFLASEDSDYCVGGIFTVDGGLTAV